MNEYIPLKKEEKSISKQTVCSPETDLETEKPVVPS